MRADVIRLYEQLLYMSMSLVTLFWQAIRARLRDVMSIFPLHTNLHACISHVLSLSLPD
jgi:hypothetical protein